jgi:hypothetical protein
MVENLIPNILYKLFKNNKKVVIAEFGYFEVTHQSATYNAETKTLCPPMNFLYFKNENAKSQSDDILAKKLAQNLNISESDAVNNISVWIDEICMKLAEFGKAELGATGEFFINDEGQISFRFSDETNIMKDSYGLEEVKT